MRKQLKYNSIHGTHISNHYTAAFQSRPASFISTTDNIEKHSSPQRLSLNRKLGVQLIKLSIIVVNSIIRLLDTGTPLLASLLVLLPSLDIRALLLALAQDGVDANTSLALGRVIGVAVHDQFHAAGLAGAVLAGALLLAVAPFEVAAVEDGLVVEAHVDGGCGRVLEEASSS